LQGCVLKSIVLAPSDADVKAEVSAWAEPVPTLRVGFFGICTEHTPQLSFPGPTVVFDDAVRHARAMVEQLQVAGADVVIALTHLKLVSDVELLKVKKCYLCFFLFHRQNVFASSTYTTRGTC
jgi:hypothetical protein